MWESHGDFASTLEGVWKEDTCMSMHGLERKLKGLSTSLSSWGRDTFGHVRKELKLLKRELSNLRAQADRVGPNHRELKMVERIVVLQHREETMWR